MPKEFQELLVIHQSLILHVLVGLSFVHLVQFRYFQQKNTFFLSKWSLFPMIAPRIDFCSSAFDPTAATIADKQILFRQPSLWKYNWRRNRNTQIYKSKYNWRRNTNTQIYNYKYNWRRNSNTQVYKYILHLHITKSRLDSAAVLLSMEK